MLKMKYFVLKPKGDTVHAAASRRAMLAYADWVRNHGTPDDAEFVRQLDAWARDEAIAAIDAGGGGDGWQTIDSAPHETEVLLYSPVIGHSAAKMEVGMASTGHRWDNGYSNMSWHGYATHWRPLPSPPSVPQLQED